MAVGILWNHGKPLENDSPVIIEANCALFEHNSNGNKSNEFADQNVYQELDREKELVVL